MPELRESTKVAPLAGAWIETELRKLEIVTARVAPLAGAWIETLTVSSEAKAEGKVAPLAGAWIETFRLYSPHLLCARRAPRGRVD